tara:strand:- start:23229 stop:23765 length:537 start_codon:yes stop_codon:yes gene_type:complete
MGHSTNYSGALRINNLDLAMVRKLKSILGGDKRDLVKTGLITQAEFEALGYSYHFDMELNDEMTALKWNESEKTNGLEDWLNMLAVKFNLAFQEGDNLVCQGEDMEDRYLLLVEAGAVVVRKGADAASGTLVYITMGQYYDEQEIGPVFASPDDAADYCIKRNRGDSLIWEVTSRTLA